MSAVQRRSVASTAANNQSLAKVKESDSNRLPLVRYFGDLNLAHIEALIHLVARTQIDLKPPTISAAIG